jgi:flagellar hook-associated protein 3 FlgL
MYYKNVDISSSRLNDNLFDVNKQISSGRKIQYAHDDVETFAKTVHLDDEISTLNQVKKSSENGLKFSTQTDTVINEFTTTLDTMKVKLLTAANEIHSDESMEALAKEMRQLENHLRSLANTSINGQYLFSGSKTSTKPIDNNGNYRGNDGDLKAFFGQDLEQKYNVSGADLFLGEESTLKREITTNIGLKLEATGNVANQTNTLEEITGSAADQTFYLRGTNHDGSTFKDKFTLPSSTTVESLLQSLEGTNRFNNVSISLDGGGHIVIADEIPGSSKLDFHLVAGDDVNDIDNLTPSIEFMKSALSPAAAAAAGSESALYDRNNFTHNGVYLESNTPQILKGDNSFAVDATKLDDVFSSLTSTLHVSGNRLDGTGYDIDINFGSPAAVSGDYNYNVADGQGNTTNGSDMTYRQLMDVINMAINNETPADSGAGYQAAIDSANANSLITLSSDGKITLEDLNNNPTLADIAIYDTNSDDFSNNSGAMATFQSNNSLTIRDPKTDFFERIDEVIASVEKGKNYADGNTNNPRNGGIQNAIQMIEDITKHITKQHTDSGVQSQVLEYSISRTDILLINTETLRSDILDTDTAEAYLRLEQLKLNQQAIYSTVSKISQLSLVNYL